MGYLLSIVVPTKDRYNYLKHLIQLVQGFKSNEIELVIQDNTYDNTEICDYLKENVTDHVSYFHTKEQLSMSDNSTKAILNSQGEYVCFLGDDDGVVRNIIDVVKWMKSNNIDALTSKIFEYNWPDYVDNSRYHMSGVVFSKLNSKKSGLIDIEKSLKSIIRDGFGNIIGLPRLYQGIVKRTCLDKVFDKYGSYFPGPSPDMANAIALVDFVNRYYYLDEPVVITGQSRSYGGGEKLLKGKLKKVTEIPFMPKDVLETWDCHLPQLWCSDTIWPQSAIVVLNKQSRSVKYNYERIYARFVFHHPQYKETLKGQVYNKIKFNWYLFEFKINDYLKFIKARLWFALSNNNIVGGNRVVRDVRDIQKAESVIFNEYVVSR